MASKNQLESVASRGSFASDAPFVCMDCARRHVEPVGFYRVAARAPRDCTACGEGPLVDIRDPAVIEALRARDEQRRACGRRRTSMAAMGVAAAIVVPLVAIKPNWCRYGLLTGPVVTGVTALAMLVVASLLANPRVLRVFAARRLFEDLYGPALPEEDQVENEMRRGWGILRAAAILTAAVVLTAALPAMVWRFQQP